MYTIYAVNSGTQYMLHSPTDDAYKLINPVLKLELNKTGTLAFDIDMTHPNKAQVKKMESEIVVYDGDTKLWTGRPIESSLNFYNTETVTCEGILGYLLDTQMPPFVNQDGIRSFLTTLLNNHNTRVGASSKKAIQLGDVTVTDDNDYIYRESTNYNSTLDLINEKLVNSLGGYIFINERAGVRYLDYLATAIESEQTVTFGENLIDMTRYIKADELCTAVIPLGADYEVTTGSGEQETTETKTLDLKTYQATNYHPSGADYVYDPTAVATYGYVYKVVEFKNVTLQANLYTKALEYLQSAYSLTNSIELTAVDLSLIDSSLDSFKLGDFVTVTSTPHSLTAEYMVDSITYDLATPSKSSLSLGGTAATYTRDIADKQKEIQIGTDERKNRLKEVSDEIKTNKAQTNAKIANDIAEATDLLTGDEGGYVILDRDANGKPFRILAMDTDSIDTATSMIILNQNGLGFRTRPSASAAWGNYSNAWTIDGQLIADYVTAGHLTAGTIGGWTIGQTILSNGNVGEDDFISLSPQTGILLGNGVFSVDETGKMICSNADVEGDIYAYYLEAGVDAGDPSAYNKWKIGAIESSKGVGTAIYGDSGDLTGQTEGFRAWIKRPTGSDDWVFAAIKRYQGGSGWNNFGTAWITAGGEGHFQKIYANNGNINLSALHVVCGQYYLSYHDSTGGIKVDQIISTGGMWAPTFNKTSDRRQKKDIVTLDYAKSSEFIYGLIPVEFKYIGDESEKKNHGFIAQDVQEVEYDDWSPCSHIPDQEGETDILSLEYEQLIADLVKTVQLQHSEIEELKARVTALENR